MDTTTQFFFKSIKAYLKSHHSILYITDFLQIDKPKIILSKLITIQIGSFFFKKALKIAKFSKNP